MAKNAAHTCELVRVRGRLVEVSTVRDEGGNVLHRSLRMTHLEVYLHDFVQIIVGATLLAVPMGFTQETWDLGEQLAMPQVAGVALMALAFLAVFIYYNSYRGEHFREHADEFVKRLLSTYLLALGVAALLLTVIDKAPWGVDAAVAFKRSIIVAFPASLSAAVADMIK